MANYGTHPLTLLFPVLGFAGLWATMKLVAAGPGWSGLSGSPGDHRHHRDRRRGLFPFILPSRTDPNSSLIVWDAVSSHLTLTVMFWAAVIFIPLILAYTTWTYRRCGGG